MQFLDFRIYYIFKSFIYRPITPNNSTSCYTVDNVNATSNSDFYENFAVKLSSTELAASGMHIVKFHFL